MLRDRLRPVAAPDSPRIARLIAMLDDDDYAVRQCAMQTLEDIGEAARPALETAHRAPPSIEARRRIEALLARCESQPPAPDSLRALRALELLEQIGTSEARQVIAALTKGYPGVRVTSAAIATLRRVSRQ